MLRIKPRTSSKVGKHSATKLHPQPGLLGTFKVLYTYELISTLQWPYDVGITIVIIKMLQALKRMLQVEKTIPDFMQKKIVEIQAYYKYCIKSPSGYVCKVYET